MLRIADVLGANRHRGRAGVYCDDTGFFRRAPAFKGDHGLDDRFEVVLVGCLVPVPLRVAVGLHLHAPHPRVEQQFLSLPREVRTLTVPVRWANGERWPDEHCLLAGFGDEVPSEERGARVQRELPEQPTLVDIHRDPEGWNVDRFDVAADDRLLVLERVDLDFRDRLIRVNRDA